MVNSMVDPNTDSPNGVRTVVVPAAGMGTRFLPATKTVPKELLPVVDTPGIELIAEEASQLGATRLAIITAPKKDGILRHFAQFPELVETLSQRGKDEQVAKVRKAAELISPVAVVQEKPLGLGHAVSLAEAALDDDESAFAVMLPDDLVMPTGVMEKMAAVRAEFGGSVLCAFEVPRDEVFNYGVFDVEEIDTATSDLPAGRVKRVTGMVEKPEPDEAPSTFVAVGRYLLDRAIFGALGRIEPGKGGEIQLTDAIELLIREGHPVHIVVHEGARHDLGNPAGYIPANVDFGLRNPNYGKSLYKSIKKIMDKFEADHGL